MCSSLWPVLTAVSCPRRCCEQVTVTDVELNVDESHIEVRGRGYSGIDRQTLTLCIIK